MRSPALYAAAGETLHHYAVDVERAAIEHRDATSLPVGVQYAWPHPRLPLLYCACSNGSPGVLGDTHCAIALRIGPSGTLSAYGDAVTLPARPIHITVDRSGEHALIAYNIPSALTVHRIAEDGKLGAALSQDAPVDVGIFAHQVRVMPSNRTVVLVTRGNDAGRDRNEDPGALKIFDYRGGKLTDKASVAPNGGYGFGPRHIDFHPTQPWVYVSLERQNRLDVFYAPGDGVEPQPRFSADTLVNRKTADPEQRAGTIHIHPRGHVAYVANRANAKSGVGESNIAVFALDPATGAPRCIQHIDTRGFVPRTFSIDPSGHSMIVANSEARGEVAPNLGIYRIAEDGRLTYVSTEQLDTRGKTLFWSAIV